MSKVTINANPKYLHIRVRDGLGDFMPKGGVTAAVHGTSSPKSVYVQLAVCHPNECYNKKLGRETAKKSLNGFFLHNIEEDRSDVVVRIEEIAHLISAQDNLGD